MPGLPIPLVLQGPALEDAERALTAAGELCRHASAQDAAESVNGGWAEVVVLGRAPGWQALAARVQNAGGAAVLLGPAPEPGELRLLESGELDSAEDAAALPALVAQLRSRLQSLREIVAAGAEADQARAAAQIARFAQSIALQLGLDRVVAESISRTRDLCDADGASLLLVDPVTGALTFDVVDGSGQGHIEKSQLQPGEGIAGQVAKSAEATLVEDVRQCPHFHPGSDDASGFVTGSVIAAPLVLAGDLLGVVEAVRGADRPPFTQAHLQRMVDLATHVSIAIYNAQITTRLREAQAQVMRDNAELERRIAERTAQIGRAKREWEATFDAISEPLAVQEGFTIRRANLAWARRADIPITQVTGRTCYELFAGRQSPCPGCPLAAASTGAAAGAGELNGEITAREHAYRFTGFRLPAEDGHPSGIVVHYEDVTRQRALEQRLRESERLAALGQLADGAAHEINNPMAYLASNLSSLKETLADVGPALDGAREAAALLARGDATGARRALAAASSLDEELLADGVEMVEESLDGARRVRDIVRGLRELSRQQVSRVHAADANASITRVLRAELGEEADRVRLDLRAQAEAAIDPLQLDQAVGHLLRNARQAVSGPGAITVRTWSTDAEVLLEVVDEGCGIPPEHLHRLFEPFFSTRGVGRGIGLGLTATWGIAQRHGGRVEVQSAPGEGSRFTLHLPQVSQSPGKSAGEPAPSSEAASAPPPAPAALPRPLADPQGEGDGLSIVVG